MTIAGHSTGNFRCRYLKGRYCLELIRAVNQFCWFDQGITGGPYKRLNLETKRIATAVSSTTWSVTWPSVFGESHIWWAPDQWKERTAKPWTCFVNDSSVTVELDCVLKFYLWDVWIVMTGTLWAVLSCMYACLYILKIWNVKLYDYPELILIFYRLVTFKNLLHTLPSQYQCNLQHRITSFWFFGST